MLKALAPQSEAKMNIQHKPKPFFITLSLFIPKLPILPFR